MKKVLLINPPSGLYRRDDRCQSRVEEQTVNIIFPPMDLATLAAMARKTGAEPRIADFPATGQGWEHLENLLDSFVPDIVLISTTSATVSDDLQVGKSAKKVNPECLVISKGEYLSHFGIKALQAHPSLDVILLGEPEIAFEEIVKGIQLDNIPGIVFRKKLGMDEDFVQTGERRLIEDLDQIPFPARDILDNSLYRSPESGNPLTVINANRGCPAHCIFCPAGKISGYKLRFRSPENIVEEVKECVEQFGIREFLFNGDTFTMHKSWLLKLCRLIRETNYQIRWGCNSRVDTFDLERAKAIKSAGCWVVAFGIESGVQEMLDKMKKKTRLDQAVKAVETAKKAGLLTHAFYVIGLPWETRETLKQSLEFAKILDTDFFDFNIAYPLPGTEYYDIAKKEGLFEESRLSEGSYGQAAIRSYEVSSDELTSWRKKALISMYLRPGYVFRTLLRV